MTNFKSKIYKENIKTFPKARYKLTETFSFKKSNEHLLKVRQSPELHVKQNWKEFVNSNPSVSSGVKPE